MVFVWTIHRPSKFIEPMAVKIIPSLVTNRLILRPFSQEDATVLQLVLDDPDVWRYFPRTEVPTLSRTKTYIEGQLAHWEEYGYGHWAIITGDKVLIGWCGLQFLPDTHETEVAYCLGRDFWGKGIATEAARASLDFGMIDLGIKEIVGLTHVENKASQHVLQKIGLKFVERKTYFGMECFRFRIST
jgi:[ribosomal protein S5]-alanine N-acetyltransferase